MTGITTNDLWETEGITNPPLLTKLLNGVNPLNGGSISIGLKVENDSLKEIGSGSLNNELIFWDSFKNELLCWSFI